MPCDKISHTHSQSWPTSGKTRFVIESCETRCAWCERSGFKAANNLRMHAGRHIKKEEILKDVVIVPGTAGRGRVVANFVPHNETDERLQAEPTARKSVDGVDPKDEYWKRRSMMLEDILRRNGIDIEAELVGVRNDAGNLIATGQSSRSHDLVATPASLIQVNASEEADTRAMMRKKVDNLTGDNLLLKLKVIAMHRAFYSLNLSGQLGPRDVSRRIQASCHLKPEEADTIHILGTNYNLYDDAAQKILTTDWKIEFESTYGTSPDKDLLSALESPMMKTGTGAEIVQSHYFTGFFALEKDCRDLCLQQLQKSSQASETAYGLLDTQSKPPKITYAQRLQMLEADI